MNKHSTTQLNDTPTRGHKKKRVIALKRKYNHLSLKEIAKLVPCNYSYARHVWSYFIKKQSTIKGEAIDPLIPINVHGTSFYVGGLEKWYVDCPVEPSDNRNGQKVRSVSSYTFVIHKGGQVSLAYFKKSGEKELRKWLGSWMHTDEVELFFDGVYPSDRKHIAAKVDGVPTGYKIKVPGMATATLDKTPFPQGTVEVEMDVGFEKNQKKLIRNVNQNTKRLDNVIDVLEKQAENTGVYAKGMDQHMILIGELQNVAKSLIVAVDELREDRKQSHDLYLKILEKLDG